MSNYSNIESFNPRECISGQIGRIHRLTANIFRKYIAQFNITNSQLTILFILSKNQGLTQNRLAEIAKLEKSSLHRNLKRLIDFDLLDRKNFPVIEITEKGREQVNLIIPEWRKAMNEIKEIIGVEGELAINQVHQKLTNKF